MLHAMKAVVVWICGMLFVVSSVNAKSVDRFKINVPFPFVLNGQTLPAGRYSIERIDSTKPNMVTLKKATGGIVRVVLMQRVEKESPSAESSLKFIRREGKHYLFQVWNVGAMNGSQVPYESEQSDRQRTSVTFVTLRSKAR